MIIGGVCWRFRQMRLLISKAFGFTLDERFSKTSIWCWVIGFISRLRRSYAGPGADPAPAAHPDPSWQPLLPVAEFRAIVIFWDPVPDPTALRRHPHARTAPLDLTSDPSLVNPGVVNPSPPPVYSRCCPSQTIDAFWHMKRTGGLIKPNMNRSNAA